MEETAQRMRLLFVDDSSLMRKASVTMLKEEFDVITAGDGLAGWKLLQADPSIQIVFTDLSMPVMDGHELLARIRKHDTGINTLPVILMTSVDNDETARISALEMGATDFIAKPFNATHLLARARAHANHLRETSKLREQVSIDPVSGLANKHGFIEGLKQNLAYAKRHEQSISVVMIEVDNFEAQLQQYGKTFTEGLTVHVGKIISHYIRREDTAARISDAEFALVLPTCKLANGKMLADRIRARISSTPVYHDGSSITVSISAGALAPASQAELSAASVMRACRRLLDSALESGGDRVAADQDNDGDCASGPDPAHGRAVESLEDAQAMAGEAGMPPGSMAGGEQTPQPGRGVDRVLAWVEQGNKAAAIAQLPGVMDRMIPLFRLLTQRQRQQLINFLQRLD